MTMQLSKFPVIPFNAMAQHYQRLGLLEATSQVSTYQEFVDTFPVTTKSDLSQSVERLRRSKTARPASYVVATSGSSAAPSISFWGTWQNENQDAHMLDVRRFIGKHLFHRTDVVANLLAAGGFGSLYEGMNRVLAPLGVSIVPLGRFDQQENRAYAIQALQLVRTNCVVATPAGIAELAQACLDYGVHLDIEKVVFIGERMSSARRRFLGETWPNCKISGLYGTTEVGLVGINPVGLEEDEYLVLSRWAFIERDADGALLMTDLSCPLVPLIRYRVGDFVSSTSDKLGAATTRIRLGERVDRCFSLVGNLLNPQTLQKAIESRVQGILHLQFQLASAAAGQERLHVVVDLGLNRLTPERKKDIEVALCALPQIGEGISRGVLRVSVGGAEQQRVNARGKIVDFVDERNGQDTQLEALRVR